MKPICLYSLPYAGGNAWSYRDLAACFPPGITLKGIELPGRGTRCREALCHDLEALADDAFAHLQSRTLQGRYALFGHSMGALLALLCTLRIHRAGLPLPTALFLSGHSAPAQMEKTTHHQLPQAEFLGFLQSLGGCPAELLQNTELLDFFLPILRADFTAVENWQPAPPEALPVPIVVLSGRDEISTSEKRRAWSDWSSVSCEWHDFDGGHFFLHDHRQAVASVLARALADVLSAPSEL